MGERISAADLMPDDFTITGMIRHQGAKRFHYSAIVHDQNGARTTEIHNRFGSWMIDMPDGMRKEPEAYFGPERGRRVKFVMVQKCSDVERRIRIALGQEKPPREKA